MAADPQPDWLSCLPPSWTYGVTRDGRIFFISEEAKSTTWLHPLTGEAVLTGHSRSSDLPTGWEEGFTYEGARCFINHNERKVTCKHPVSGVPSQDNCIFVVNEHVSCGKFVHPDRDAISRPAQKSPSEPASNNKDRPLSTMSEASNYTGGSNYTTGSNYTGGSNYSTFPCSPATTTSSSSNRPSRPSKKVHNFGKRSNSIKRNLKAPVVKSSWLYKQDSTGMKLWKKRWFVLSDMCLFYYRDEKEDSILGSILLPSFHVSMLSVDDHISRKYAFKATHPNMRTYYFCTDTGKEMESWMKVMTDASLVHTEPIKRMDKLKVDQRSPQELNNMLNHRVLTPPEIHNNERNREPARQHSLSRADDKRPKNDERLNIQREYYTLQRDGERYSVKKDGVSYMLQKDGEKFLLHKDGEKFLLRKDGEKYSLQKDEDVNTIHRDLEKYAVHKVDNKYAVTLTDEKYAPSKEGEKYLLAKDGERYALQKVGDRHTLQKDGHKHVPQKEVRRQLSLKETERFSSLKEGSSRYGTIQVVDRYGALKEVRKYATLREGDRYASLTDSEKFATVRVPSLDRKPSTDRNRNPERSLTKISSIKLQPAQAAAIAAAVSASRQNQAGNSVQRPVQMSSTCSGTVNQHRDCSQTKVEENQTKAPVQGPDGGLSRTDSSLSRSASIQQLEQWTRIHLTRGLDEDTRSITSYQTLPRNMPSHRAPITPRYPEGYRTLPRNSMMRPDSICSVAGSVYDRTLLPASTGNAEKRRSMRDDTMWQLYEWQQRQAFSRQSLALPAAVGHYGTLPSTRTMGSLSEHAAAPSIPTSPSHGSLAMFSTFSLPRQQVAPNPGSSQSEVSSPVLRGDATLDRRHRTHLAKYGYPPDRRSMAANIPPQTITPQTLQGKTVSPDDLADGAVVQQTDKVDIDTQLSRLCEQDQAVRLQEEKMQQLLREKHTLEAALLSASQELSEQSGDAAANQSLIQQRDVLQSGLLSTCRELSRVSTELQRSWTEYERLEAEVTQAKTNLLEQLEALGSPQTEPPSQRHIQIQKELWRIQDVMEALSKTRPQRNSESGVPGSKALSSQDNEQAPDYRMYKSEPELTTVKEEVDEANVEDKTEASAESKVATTAKAAPPYPVGIVPPRTKSPMSPPESSTIASYVTLRKTKRAESRSDRPRSAVDQVGLVEREVGRMRMSVEEQLERMRRNQEALLLREKKRETPSRSQSFSRDNPPPVSQRCLQPGVVCPDPVELEAALQQLKAEQSRTTSREHDGTLTCTQETQRSEEVKNTYNQKEEEKMQRDTNCTDEMCESQTVVILDLGSQQQQVEIIDFQPFDGEQDVTSSPTNPPTDNSFQTLSPEPMEETDRDGQTSGDQLEQNLDSGLYSQRHTNMLPSQTFTLVTSDT